MVILIFMARKGIVGSGKEGQINNYNRSTLQVTGCMCGFLAKIWMHGTCMWLFDYFVFIGMGFAWIDSGFSLALPFPR